MPWATWFTVTLREICDYIWETYILFLGFYRSLVCCHNFLSIEFDIYCICNLVLHSLFFLLEQRIQKEWDTASDVYKTYIVSTNDEHITSLSIQSFRGAERIIMGLTCQSLKSESSRNSSSNASIFFLSWSICFWNNACSLRSVATFNLTWSTNAWIRSYWHLELWAKICKCVTCFNNLPPTPLRPF